nr:integrase, catalytic region, zinc finger, CCHC-type, peptidase aspartic, catalytic [Tanacetum cinerariifolium]
MFIIKFMKMIQVRLNVPVRRIRTDNGTEFVNQTLWDYYEEVVIFHETSIARSPQQNGVVERRNRTLIEAAHYYVNLHSSSFVSMGKGCGNRMFYTESIHYSSSPWKDSSSSGPALQEMTHRTISSGLVQKSSSSTSYVPPLRNDWDLLFQPMFDELLNPPLSVDNQTAAVIAPIAEVISQVDDDSTGLPSSKTVNQDAPSPSKSPTPTEIQSSVILQDVGNDNLDIEVAHMGNDPLLGVHIPKVTSEQNSSTASPKSNVQPNHPMTHHNNKWTKDHPLNYIIGPLSRPVSIGYNYMSKPSFAITMLS